MNEYDEVAVSRMLSGEHAARGRARVADVDEVIRRAVALCWTDGQIAYATGRWRRSIYRRRAALSLAAPHPSGRIDFDVRPLLPNRPFARG